MKIFSRRAHGFADYLIVVVFLSVPTALGFTGAARILSYSVAFLHLLVTAFSAFPPGALRLMRFPYHAAVESVTGVFLIVSPWLLHFANNVSARDTFMILGAALLVMASFTDFDRRREVVPPPPGDRRRRYFRRGR